MIVSAIDHTPLDVDFCGSLSDYVARMRKLERLHALLAVDLCQWARPPVQDAGSALPVASLVVDQGPEFMSAQCESALAQLPNRGGSHRD